MILLTSSLESFLQLIGVLLIFVFVLVLTYATSKWIGGYQKTQMTGRGLQIVETVRIAGNKYIQIIKTGEVYLVIAVGKDTVTMLAKLTREEYGSVAEQLAQKTQKESGSEIQGSFEDVLGKVKDRFSKKQD